MVKLWKAFNNVINVGWTIVKALLLLGMILTVTEASASTVYVLTALYFMAIGAFSVFVFSLIFQMFKKS